MAGWICPAVRLFHAPMVCPLPCPPPPHPLDTLPGLTGPAHRDDFGFHLFFCLSPSCSPRLPLSISSSPPPPRSLSPLSACLPWGCSLHLHNLLLLPQRFLRFCGEQNSLLSLLKTGQVLSPSLFLPLSFFPFFSFFSHYDL